MKWIRFWLRAPGSSFVEEEYNVYPSSFTDDEIKDSCERWVEKYLRDQGDGSFEYDFEVIDAPPKKWLVNSIGNNTMKIAILKKNNEYYEEIIEEHYRLNDKIEKLKNNIDDEVV